MTYTAALEKGWNELKALSAQERHSVTFLGDTYEVDMAARTVISLSCNVPAKDFAAILLLHYLAGSLKGGYRVSGEWISFKEMEGGEIYYPAFRESSIKPILRKYGEKPEALAVAAERLKARKVTAGDAAIEIDAFKDVAIRVIVWKGDDEFGPEAQMLFDSNIARIFPTEDVAVLSRIIARTL
jgi:hypothetical protein